jgi:hypothetical protein
MRITLNIIDTDMQTLKSLQELGKEAQTLAKVIPSSLPQRKPLPTKWRA